MELARAVEVSAAIVEQLKPHCERIEIAGSVRRQKETVGDIEVVCIPKPYDVGLFESGIATVVCRWEKVRGELPCKYTQRLLPYNKIKLDLFFATPDNFGLILAIRTGSQEFSKRLARAWVSRGYRSNMGTLWRNGAEVPTPSESEVFQAAGLPWVEPKLREV